MQRNKNGQFSWTDLSAKDFDKQAAFYEGLFGWTFTDMPFGEGQTYRMYKKDGHTVAAISQMQPQMIANGVPSMWNNYLYADDVAATADRAVELGGSIAMPAREVPGDGGMMAAIEDPTGAFLFLWHANRPDATTVYGEPGTLAWTDLNTTDPAKAAAFYSALVGWDIAQMQQGPMPYWQVSVDGEGEGGIMPMPEGDHSFWMPYFGSADIDADVAKAGDLGATIHVPPTEAGGGMISFAVLTDPQGATFALMQMLGTPPA